MPKSQSRLPDPESEWFGFRRVSPREKAALVSRVFSAVASNYDVMNDAMSLGMHRLWKDVFARRIRLKPHQTLIDVAGGTGDIALRCYRRCHGKANIIVCDINPAMLDAGKAKAIDQGILKGLTWMVGNAEDLPLQDRSCDTYSIAFGLRNITHIDKALKEAARILKPGGRFLCMEFSPGVVPAIKSLYERYCMTVIPALGGLIANDRDAYQYLAESILKFPIQKELAQRIKAAGLEQVTWTNLTGGIAVIHEAYRF